MGTPASYAGLELNRGLILIGSRPPSLKAMIPYMMSIAGAMALISSIGMGIFTSETLQVGLYSGAQRLLDATKAATPAWLVSKGDLDTPLEFLSDGPVADGIIAATLAANALEARAKTQIELVATMNTAAANLDILEQNLRLAATTTWSLLDRAGWVRRYKEELTLEISVASAAANRSLPLSILWFNGDGNTYETLVKWKEGNRSIVAEITRRLQNFEAAELDEVVRAYGSPALQSRVRTLEQTYKQKADRGELGIQLSVKDGGSLVFTPVEPQLAADFTAIELGLTNATALSAVRRLVEYRLKERLVVSPRLVAIRAAIGHEQAQTAYRDYWNWERERSAKLARAEAHLLNTPAAAAAFENFLTKLQSWGFDFPEDIGRKVPAMGPWLTRRDLERLRRVEIYRGAPNRWVTLFVVSGFLGVVGFFMSICSSLAFIVNMGILGTARNLVGVLYVRSEGALRRAQIEEQRSVLALRDSVGAGVGLSPVRTLQDRDGHEHTD